MIHRMAAMMKRLVGALFRPVKELVYPLLGRLVRRGSQRFAAEIVPLAQLGEYVRRLDERQDRFEALYWDRSAVARRLAAIEDQLEALLQREAGGPEAEGVLRCAGSREMPATGEPGREAHPLRRTG